MKKANSIPVLTSFFLIILFCLMSSGVSLAGADGKTGGFNYSETSGIINVPNARAIDYRTAVLSVRLSSVGKHPPIKHQWQDPGGGVFTGTPFDSDWWIYCDGDRRALISPVRNLEVNLMHIRSQQKVPVFAAKFVAFQETDTLPAVAVGIHNMFGWEDCLAKGEVKRINSKPAPFIAASKRFGSNDNLDLTVGYGGGRFRNRFFYGGELSLDRNHWLRAVGEYDGNIVSYGLKYRLPRTRWEFGAFLKDKDDLGVTFNYTMPW
jgi:hypothetical protein